MSRIFYFVHLLFIFLHINYLIATDIISQNQFISGNQTIVSSGDNFELGFFTPNGSDNTYYIGIWYKRVVEKTIVWVANRETPISDPYSSKLKISEDGKLVLLDHLKVPIWSSNSTSNTSGSSSNIIAVLLDTGNLVLKDGLNSSIIIWQSFEHPTDTWVQRSRIGMSKITGEYFYATSWRNLENPSLGLFSHVLDPNGSNQTVLLWNRSVVYWRSGEWNGRYFSLMPEGANNNVFNQGFFENNESRYFTYTSDSGSMITRTVVDCSGKLKQFLWVYETRAWMLFWSRPLDQCDVYRICGAFGVCDQTMPSSCSCLHGFEPASLRDWELNSWSGGCVRKTALNCTDNATHQEEQEGFLMIRNMKLPDDAYNLTVGSTTDCELACLRNCSCTAYSYDNKCLMWSGELHNLKQLPDGDASARTLYLRLAASDLPKSTSKRKMTIVIILSASVATVVVICSILWLTRRCQRPRSSLKDVRGSLVTFTYADLQNVTKNFSEKLGSGSFGSVFKGVMPDSSTIAVKKLEGFRQGEKQFQAEVRTLGMIHHVNLVRLRGFCSKKDKRLLVYDHMPNGSLDFHLFKNASDKVMDWRTRYQIIIGIARGLSYMHEKCRECIIHCDIKPENILLDSELQPKIADFGLAKLVGRDFSRVLTSMRGTIGYLAPEWISGQAITTKVDVYSFGMLVLEIISGRRNMEQMEEDKVYFPIWAATKVNEGDYVSLLDRRLDGNADIEELKKACKVACWCIQDYEFHRPTMNVVVQVLAGFQEVNVPPIPHSLQQLVECNSTPHPSISSDVLWSSN